MVGVVHDDHRAVVHVAHALVLVLALAGDADVQDFAGQHDHLHLRRDLGDVDAGHALQLGDLRKIEIRREKFSVQRFRQAHELAVHFLFLGELVLVNLYLHAQLVLDAVEHVESATAAGAARAVLRVRDGLHFLEHEARHHDESFDQFRLDQFHDASVNDRAGIENDLVLRAALRSEAHVGDDEREILLVAPHGKNDSDVAEGEKQAEADDPARVVAGGVEQARRIEQPRDEAAEQQAESDRGKRAQRKPLEHFVHGDDQRTKSETDDGAVEAVVNQFGQFLADGVARQRAKAEKEKSDGPDRGR